MEETVPQERASICPRCLQPVSLGTRKCPDCGVYVPRSRRKAILVGLAGALTLVFVVVLIMSVIRDEKVESGPGDRQKQSAPQSYKPPPLNP
jgi:hypothetical protein